MKTLTRDEITRLHPAERLAPIAELWDSLNDADLPTPPAQRQELVPRLATLDQDILQAVSWDDLKAELATRTR
jgi:putative addiction module component (TIGR02574 family)